MTTFAGLLATPLRVVAHNRNSKNLNLMVLDQTLDRAARWLNPRAGDYDRAGITDLYQTPRDGAIAPISLRYIYNRVMVFPQTLDLGNIVSMQTENAYVWNAYLTDIELENVTDAPSQGVTLSGQPLPPFTMRALEERTWVITVAPDGAPVVDASLIWWFEGQLPLTLRASATRIQVWPFRPNWEAGQAVLERLEWLTSIAASPLGVEQRRQLRISPRRDFQVQTIALGDERRYMELAVANWGARSWAIPIWHDVQRLSYPLQPGDTEILCDTEGFDFRDGGMLILRGPTAFDLESLQADEVLADRIVLRRPVQAGWPAGTYFYPARAAKFIEQPKMRQLTADANITEVRFRLSEVSDWEPATGLPTYLGYPVMLTRPETSQDVTSTYVRIMEMLDNGSDLPGSVDTAGVAFSATSHRFDPVGREQQAQFRSLLYFLRGRLKSVWVPTFNQDLVLVRNAIPTDVSLAFRNVGYVRFGQGAPGKRDIRIERRNGPDLFFHIDASVVDEDDSQVERLTVDRPIGETLNVADILRISFMARCRLDQDAVELNHITVDGEVFANVTFRSLRDDL